MEGVNKKIQKKLIPPSGHQEIGFTGQKYVCFAYQNSLKCKILINYNFKQNILVCFVSIDSEPLRFK